MKPVRFFTFLLSIGLLSTVAAAQTESAKKSAKAHFDRGLAFLQKKDCYIALPEFTKAMEANPADRSIYKYRGNCYLILGGDTNAELAVSDLTKAIEFDAKDTESYYFRGKAYSRLSKATRAIVDFTEAMRQRPGNPIYLLARAQEYLFGRNYGLAIPDINKALQIKPDFAEGYILRAAAYDGLSEYEAAVADYTKLIQLSPDYAPTYYFKRSDAYCRLGKKSLANADIKKIGELGSKAVPPTCK